MCTWFFYFIRILKCLEMKHFLFIVLSTISTLVYSRKIHIVFNTITTENDIV